MGLSSSTETKNRGADSIFGSQSSTQTRKKGETSSMAIPTNNARNKEGAAPIMISSPPPSTIQETLPTTFTWKNGGQEVFISGTFNNWAQKIPMKKSHDDFTCIQNLPPGRYFYRYVVDGKWKIDPEKESVAGVDGEMNNVMEVHPPTNNGILSVKDVSSSPPGSYGQMPTEHDESPPSLPPHLLRALLNTEPQGKDPSLLPLPHHVILTHLYSQKREKDNVMIYGVTQRYREKFVTTVFYKPLEETEEKFESMTEHLGDLPMEQATFH